MRRRLYLMRHGAVAYFDDAGRPVAPDDVPLTREGREQALAARTLLEDVRLDRVIASGLPRTTETAALVAPEHEIELWPDLREITGSKLSSIPAGELEEAFVHAFRGVVPNDKRFLGGETIGELFDRVVPALERLVADEAGTPSSSSRTAPSNRAILSYVLTGERMFLGRFEQAPGCLNVLDVGEDWIVRAVNVAPVDLVHATTRKTTMEQYWEQYRPQNAEVRAGAALTVRSQPSDLATSLRPAHFSFETGWNVPFVNFTIRSQLDRLLVRAARPLPVARQQERVRLVPVPERLHQRRPGSGSPRPCTSAA